MRFFIGLAAALFSCGLGAQTLPLKPAPTELTLQAAIERALAASPLLAADAAQVRAAQGEAEQVGLRHNPMLGLEVENLAGSGPYRALDGAVYTLQLSQQVELGGKRTLRRQAAERSVAGAELVLADQRLKLIEQVSSAYIRLIATREYLRLASERAELAHTLLAEVEERVKVARESQIQLGQAEIAVARSSLEKETLERELRHAQHVLASHWLGRHEAFRYDSSPLFELTDPVDEEQLEARLLGHPALRYWATEQDRRTVLVQLEKARAVPDPEVKLGLRQFDDTGDQALVLEVGVPVPVFDRNRGYIARAHAELDRAANTTVNTRLELTNLGLQALEDMVNAYRQAQTLSRSIVPAAERAFQLAHSAYISGRFPYLEVIEAQRTLFETKQSYITALEQYHLAKFRVDYVMATHDGEVQP